ncbi:flagellar hook-length control protein FliK [Dyella sp. KULCS107]|uniref:flagellar hook-length control protein FliK n=1 Tax=Dyella sp. KULCS107 TaxID=3422216 RepID=UPI003D6EA73F
MPATAALSVTPTITSTAPAPAEPRGPTDAGRAFDSHLDAARQQRDGDAPTDTALKDTTANDSSSARDAHASRKRVDGADAATTPQDTSTATDAASTTATTPAVAADPTQPTSVAEAPAPAADEGLTPDAISVAGAMLALLGQAMPANASAATGGAAKVMAASVLKASMGQAPAAGPAAEDAQATLAGSGADGTTDASAAPTTQATTTGTAALADVFAAGATKLATHKGTDGPAVQDLAALLGTAPQPTANTGVMPPHALHIASPAGSPAFAQQLGQQVAWLGNQDIKQAKIRLHPEELGQVDVSVRMQHGGQVDVTFAAQHPAAVHALQQSLPQLDTLLAQHGLSLGQAQVGQQSSGGGDGSRGGSASLGGEGGEAAADDALAAPATVSAVGLLDTFA